MAYVTTVERFVGTNNKGKEFYEETDKYDFCDDIWNYILDFTGWKYSFNLNKLGVEPLAKILRYNFNTGFANIKSSSISLEKRKNLLITNIYKGLQKRASKNVYENICSYFVKRKRKVPQFDERIKIGNEAVFYPEKFSRKILCGIVDKINDKRTIITIKPYSYLFVEDTKAIINQTVATHKYYFDKTNFDFPIKLGTNTRIYTEITDNFMWRTYNKVGTDVDYGIW